MLRYKNSLLERILLEKGEPRLSGLASNTHLANYLPYQASMSKPSFVPRRVALTSGQPICLRIWSNRLPFSVPS